MANRAIVPLFLAGLLGPAVALAAPPVEVNVTASDDTVVEGDVLTLEVVVVARIDGTLRVELPEVPKLTELSRSKREGTSISWSNRGQEMRREYAITVEYQTTGSGRVTVPPIVVKVGAEQARTDPITIEIVAAAQADAAAETARPGEVQAPTSEERQIFVRFSVDRAKAYLGQQVILDLDVYALPGSSFSVEGAGTPPNLDGFWTEVLDQPKRLTERVERVGGRVYNAYRLWRLALFPLEAGERTIATNTPLGFTMNQSIFSSGTRIRRRPPPIKLEVAPLPTEGRAPDFQASNVGVYELRASVDRSTVPAGKAVVLTLELEGRGNIKAAKLPELPALDGFRVFEPTIQDEAELKPTGVRGKKRAQILMMPTRGGRLEIPSLSLFTFNPDEPSYRRLTTSALVVAVEGEPEPTASPAPSPTAESDVRRPPSTGTLAPIRVRSSLEPRDQKPWLRPELIAAFLLPPALFFGGLGLELLLRGAKRETRGSRRRAAARAARSGLERAKALASEGNVRAAYAEIAETIVALASSMSQAELRGQTSEAIAETLARRGLDAAIARDVERELERANFARFAPGAENESGVQEAGRRWEGLITALEGFEPTEVER